MTNTEKNNLVESIKLNINKYLDFCNEKNTPYVCKLKNQKDGYETIHNYILKCVFDKNMLVPESLSSLERYLDPNFITD